MVVGFGVGGFLAGGNDGAFVFAGGLPNSVGGGLLGGAGRLSAAVPAFGLPGAVPQPNGRGGGAFVV